MTENQANIPSVDEVVESNAESNQEKLVSSESLNGQEIDEVNKQSVKSEGVVKLGPDSLLVNPHRLTLSSTNRAAHIIVGGQENSFAVPLGGSFAAALFHDEANRRGIRLNQKAITDARYYLKSIAERVGTVTDIWYRVAPIADGIEIDIGDDSQSRVRITAGNVEVIKSGSEVVFSRTYQSWYCDQLNDAQLEGLLDNLLASEVMNFAENHMDGATWAGTPALLLGKLNEIADLTIKSSPGWPRNPIALSKRLLPLQTALLSQGLKVELHRGKHRTITLTRSEVHIKAAAEAHAQQEADNHVY